MAAPARLLKLTTLAGLMLLAGAGSRVAQGSADDAPFDPLFDDPSACVGRPGGGRPALLSQLIAASEASSAAPVAVAAAASNAAPAASPPPRSETSPFRGEAQPVAEGEAPLYDNLGRFSVRVSTRSARAQTFFDQGMRLMFGFNHAEAVRSFRAAQAADPDCAMCFWGESAALGPTINSPMPANALEPALAALARAQALAPKAAPAERALITALATRYRAGHTGDRSALDQAYADALRQAAQRFPADDLIQTLYAEAVMDTQPWDYWQAGGRATKGRTGEAISALETVLKRQPKHPGAIHFYLHAMEASARPERALPYARQLGELMPGAGHMVHMPGHIYYRLGLYKEAMEVNREAIVVDERYFQGSPSEPVYRQGYHPHNIHFMMVSAQMGGDGRSATEAAAKLDAALPAEATRTLQGLQSVKASVYTMHAQFSPPEVILALPAPAEELVLVRALYHYARAVAQAARRDAAGVQTEIDALRRIEDTADFKPFDTAGVPAKGVITMARLVAGARLADAQGDLALAAEAYREAIKIQDGFSYDEPPQWYYPVRQSLGSVLLRQGRLDEAETVLRDSLGRVRNNGWALAGLVKVYEARGQRGSQRAAQKAFERTWFGPAGGPGLAAL
jgi:tetratricopeptide (TPR) repeat protein